MSYENYEKYDMLECFIQSNNNCDIASEIYLNHYPERRQPNKTIFKRLKENLIHCGSFNKPRPKKYNIEDAEETSMTVIAMAVAYPSISSRQIEADSGISRRRALGILKTHKFRPYTIRKQHHLQPTDLQRRLEFCIWYRQKSQQDPFFCRNVVWTDEAYISSAGIFNRHNEHYWSDRNPHRTVDVRTQGRFGFSVWCALRGNRVLTYHIYQENLNGQRYYEILNQKIIEEFMDNLPLIEARNQYFQQDGAPPHNIRTVSELLNTNFGNNWIGSNGPVRWPPRSPDLTPLDFFFWGHIKDKLYKKTSTDINELRQNFIDCVNSISNLHIYNAVQSVMKRCNLCIEHNGHQFEHLL